MWISYTWAVILFLPQFPLMLHNYEVNYSYLKAKNFNQYLDIPLYSAFYVQLS